MMNMVLTKLEIFSLVTFLLQRLVHHLSLQSYMYHPMEFGPRASYSHHSTTVNIPNVKKSVSSYIHRWNPIVTSNFALQNSSTYCQDQSMLSK